jgi:hypothetical protein
MRFIAGVLGVVALVLIVGGLGGLLVQGLQRRFSRNALAILVAGVVAAVISNVLPR